MEDIIRIKNHLETLKTLFEIHEIIQSRTLQNGALKKKKNGMDTADPKLNRSHERKCHLGNC